METLQEMTTKAVSRLYAMGNYGKIMATPAGEVSREIMDTYAEEELPDFLKEKLLDIEAEEAKKIVAQVNATSERVLARNGVAECPFWEQSYDKHAHWYVNYEGGLEIQFDYNVPRWYKVYSAIYEYAKVAKNLVRNGDSMTDEQIAYWALATVPKENRAKFVRAKVAEAKYRITLAADEESPVPKYLDSVLEFWELVQELMER